MGSDGLEDKGPSARASGMGLALKTMDEHLVICLYTSIKHSCLVMTKGLLYYPFANTLFREY